MGAKSWFNFGAFSFQPSDMMKLVLILILAKYFSRRHVEIRNIKHIFISALYAIVPFLLVFLQPDFGSAMIIFFIWFGMTLVSGIGKKHLLIVVGLGVISFALLWGFVFKDYQKARIATFVNPLADVQGSGYNVYQSTIAVGSGKILGKGVGFGTQSRLKFLPEYQTDFIFAAYAEEWGFAGVLLLFVLLGLILWRILRTAMLGATNFEILFGTGLAIYLVSHMIINIGMNIGLMPVTGITMPFMSYGGSHLITEFIGLGILMGMRRYSRVAHRDDMRNEFLGNLTFPKKDGPSG
jgi:rod shape determining protein RodA